MKSIGATHRQVNGLSAKARIDALAKRMVFKLLGQIRQGHLTVEDRGEVHCFGQSAQETDLRAHIFVLHPSVYRMVLLKGTIGSGEAYMLHAWRSPDLVQVIRLMVRNMEMIQKMDSRWSSLWQSILRLGHRLRDNSKPGAKKNIAAHYDLSNDFFSLFLDPTMLYSSAIYPQKSSSLHEASVFKMRHICERLQLNEEDHLLEIGSGWGGMAVYAAKHYGCRVTSVTISREQYDYAIKWVIREGLKERVTILLKDYRDIQGRFDKIVSIEMVEAVGYRYYQTFFSACSNLLSPQGLMLMQTITIADQRFEKEKDNVDFIQQYVFPGGCLPSIEVVTRHISRYTDMQMVGLEDITLHYARTLAEWRERFFQREREVKTLGFDDVFIRMWDFYLSYCEGGFRERVIGTSQMLFAKPRCQSLPNMAPINIELNK